MPIICRSGNRDRMRSTTRLVGGFSRAVIGAARSLAAGLLLAGVAPVPAAGGPPAADCTSLVDTIGQAAAQWPKSPHYVLEEQIGRSFIAGYNRTRTGGAALIADTVVVFPLLRSDTWYVLAGRDGCFVFWAELAPDRLQKLMENGPRGPVNPRHEEF